MYTCFFQLAGFNKYIDLTYPLTCQTALSDGKKWQFVSYQLNTLELWKDNEANSYNNLCWMGPEIQLFESVANGKLEGFNPDTLRRLIASMCLAPVKPTFNLRPTLPPEAHNPQVQADFIPEKPVEEEVDEKPQYVVY